MRSQKVKDVTINDLAVMVKNGFEHVDVRFEQVDKRFEHLEGRMNNLEGGMDQLNSRMVSLGGRMSPDFRNAAPATFTTFCG
ncbi:MAG: hypothetical protein HZA94_00495 [Candidatus Vogelbacteria bacterium]|nr:hypothetical protein [Candidatus Vogelbacteria bacterium]